MKGSGAFCTGCDVISASSSAAAGLIGGYFQNASGNGAAGGAGNSVLAAIEGAGSGFSSDAYILDGALGAGGLATFLSNAEFAKSTEALLRDPRENGALTG